MIPDKDKEELYKSLVDLCLESSNRLRDDEGKCLVVEAAKLKQDLKYYKKNKCGYERDGTCNFGKNIVK